MAGEHAGAPYLHPAQWDQAFEPLAVPDLLFRAAAASPAATALDFYGARTSYAELAAQVRRAAGGFQALGLGKGARIGLFLPNCPHYVIAYYGAMAAGATVVNFSPLYSPEELEWQAADAGVDTMVCLDAVQLFPTISKVLASGRLKRLIVGNVPEALPPLKRMAFNLLKGKERSPVPADDRHLPFARLLGLGQHKPVAIDPVQDVALIQYSGGTTGRPKGAILTHANLSVNAQQVHAIDPDPAGEDRILAALPFFHVFANTAVLNRTVLRGGTIVILPKFAAADALAAIRRCRITALPGVPAMFAALVDHPDAQRTSWSSLRIAISGGAALPLELQQRFEALTACRLVEGYGMTETSGVASANPYLAKRMLGSIGQPLPGTSFVVVDKDDPTRPPPPGEPGELTISGPQVMRRYLHGTADDASAFVDGRLRTGDVGYVDAEGFVCIVDRMKDMIVVGGFKVFPSRIEDVAYTHPAVAEAVAIAVPDPRVGERPKLYVSLRPASRATEAELLALVNAHVGKHERPVAVEIRDSLPKTVIGKLDRKALVAEARAQAAGA